MRSVFRLVFLLAVVILPLVVSGLARAQSASTATLEFDPEWIVYAPNAQVSVDVIVNPGNHSIDGADAIITYDRLVLTVVSVETTDYFNTYPVRQWDTEKINISGLAAINQPLSSSGIMATITFTVASNPPTQTALEFITSADSGSHIAENGTTNDVLYTTNTLTMSTQEQPPTNFLPTSTPTPTLAPGQPTPTSTPTPTILLPKSGITTVTVTLASILIFLLIAGAFLLL